MTGKRPTSKDVRDAELTASTGCGADHAVFQLILHLHHRLADLEQGVAWLASRPAQRATANLEQDHAHSMPAPAPAAPLLAFPLTLVDTGERRHPVRREVYCYLPTGTIHNWEDTDSSEEPPSNFAILAIRPTPAPTPALDIQTATPDQLIRSLAVETARLNWVIEAVVKIHPALLGFHEDELRGPADVTLGELFRAAVDRRLI